MIKQQPNCQTDFDHDSIMPDEAKARIFAALEPISGTESVPLKEALDRVLAENIKSTIDVPSARNAAMDGYAICAQDLPKSGNSRLKIIGKSLAGAPFDGNVVRGECVRITTGAVMPTGTDTVVIQELVQATDEHITIDHSTSAGSNVREAGEDIASGAQVLAKGSRLSPAALGLLASIGIAQVPVVVRPKVGFFSTGDELRSVDTPLSEGLIYDSNRYTLHGMLSRLNVEVIDFGVVKDDPELMNAVFLKAKDQVDVLISTGGVSVGEADYVKDSLTKNGTINFWKIAIKPGRPLTFGKLGHSYFFGLPGNPVSVMVTFYQFVQPALKQLSGETTTTFIITVPCLSKLKKRKGRVEYQRGILQYDANGQLVVAKTGAQGSGILHSMALANCFIVLGQDREQVMPNELVTVQPFYGMV